MILMSLLSYCFLPSPCHIHLLLLRPRRSPINGGSWNDRRTNGAKWLQFGLLSLVGWIFGGPFLKKHQRCQLSSDLSGFERRELRGEVVGWKRTVGMSVKRK